jgi:hypothetical protein
MHPIPRLTEIGSDWPGDSTTDQGNRSRLCRDRARQLGGFSTCRELGDGPSDRMRARSAEPPPRLAAVEHVYMPYQGPHLGFVHGREDLKRGRGTGRERENACELDWSMAAWLGAHV